MSQLVWWKVHAAFLHFSFLFLVSFLGEVKSEGPKKERGAGQPFPDSGCIDGLIYYIVIVITIVITLTF